MLWPPGSCPLGSQIDILSKLHGYLFGFSYCAGFFSAPRRAWGKNPACRRACGLVSFPQNIFYLGGSLERSPQAPARRRSHAGAPKCSAVFAAPSVNFRCSFAAMATVAQALQVASIGEQRPISTVIHDVVHIRGSGTHTTLSAFAAPRLAHKLRWPQILVPDIRTIHPAPRLCSIAAPIATGLVLVAVSGHRQRMTSWMSAQTHRFVCQGYHLLQKTKTPKPNDAIPFGCSWAPAFNALASVNIQDDLCFAVLAPNR